MSQAAVKNKVISRLSLEVPMIESQLQFFLPNRLLVSLAWHGHEIGDIDYQ